MIEKIETVCSASRTATITLDIQTNRSRPRQNLISGKPVKCSLGELCDKAQTITCYLKVENMEVRRRRTNRGKRRS